MHQNYIVYNVHEKGTGGGGGAKNISQLETLALYDLL